MTDEALIFLAFLSLSWSLNSNSCCSVWEGISLWEGETLNHHVHHKLLVPTATTSSKLFGEVLIGIGVLNWWLSQDYSKWCTEICFPQMLKSLWGLWRPRTNTGDERSGNSAWLCSFTSGKIVFIYTQMNRTFIPGTLLCFQSFSWFVCNAIQSWICAVFSSLLPLALPLALREQLLSLERGVNWGLGSGASQMTGNSSKYKSHSFMNSCHLGTALIQPPFLCNLCSGIILNIEKCFIFKGKRAIHKTLYFGIFWRI